MHGDEPAGEGFDRACVEPDEGKDPPAFLARALGDQLFDPGAEALELGREKKNRFIAPGPGERPEDDPEIGSRIFGRIAAAAGQLARSAAPRSGSGSQPPRRRPEPRPKGERTEKRPPIFGSPENPPEAQGRASVSRKVPGR